MKTTNLFSIPAPIENGELNWLAGWSAIADQIPNTLKEELSDLELDDPKSLYIMGHNYLVSKITVDSRSESLVSLSIEDDEVVYDLTMGESHRVQVTLDHVFLAGMHSQHHNHPWEGNGILFNISDGGEYVSKFDARIDQSPGDWKSAFSWAGIASDDTFPQYHSLCSRDDNGEIVMSLILILRPFDEDESDDLLQMLEQVRGEEDAIAGLQEVVGMFEGVEYFRHIRTGTH